MIIPTFENTNPEFDFYNHMPNTSIREEQQVQESVMHIDEIRDAIKQWNKTYQGDDKHICEFANLAIRSHKHKRITRNYLEVFVTFLIQTAQSYQPDKKDELTAWLEKMRKLEKELYIITKDDNVPQNDKFIPALMGIIEGLI